MQNSMTQKLIINKFNPEPEIISQAANIINSGGLVAFPTETVYGLGADALNSEAVKKIFIAKGRPQDNPLILHVSNFDQVNKLVYLNDTAKILMREFWPGPLTLVLNAKNIIPLETRGGLNTAAIRMPDNPTALALISKSNTPIAAPSANLSGKPSPTDANTVYNDMAGKIDLILDSGSVKIGIESTVIDVSDPNKILLLRPGGLGIELIEDFLHIKIISPDSGNLKLKRSPGTRYRHYAPNIPVIIYSSKIPDEKYKNYINESAYIGLEMPNENFKEILIFNSVENYAHGLFSAFRKFEDQHLIKYIFAQWPPSNGIGLGLQDRIKRAAQG